MCIIVQSGSRFAFRVSKKQKKRSLQSSIHWNESIDRIESIYWVEEVQNRQLASWGGEDEKIHFPTHWTTVVGIEKYRKLQSPARWLSGTNPIHHHGGMNLHQRRMALPPSYLKAWNSDTTCMMVLKRKCCNTTCNSYSSLSMKSRWCRIFLLFVAAVLLASS